MISQLLDAVPSVHVLRDPTRGGVAAALCDIATTSGTGIEIEESSIPLKPEVIGASQLLGFDLLNVANEGKAIVVCSEEHAKPVLNALRSHPLGKESAIIAKVTDTHKGRVLLNTQMGGNRIVEIPTGEDLPRIC